MNDHDARTDSLHRDPFSMINRAIMTICMAGLLGATSPTPVEANVFGQLGKLYGCLVTWGIVCDTSETVVGTGPPVQPAQPIPVTCSQPFLDGLPQFLSWPKGSAKYRFHGTCSSPARPGAIMTVRWEGSWTPSETQEDRPNASETLEITGFEPFLPDRESGGKIFMFFTARCTRDPWLQSGGCNPFGAYVPDDLRISLPDIDKQSFPRTDRVLSAADKQRLSVEYQKVNPSYFSKFGVQSRLSSAALQSMTQGSSGFVMQRPSSQLQLFSRGIESDEQPRPDTRQPEEASGSSEIVREAGATREYGAIAGASTVTIDHPLHFVCANGEDFFVQAGLYRVEPVFDHQLALSGSQGAPLLLDASASTHAEGVDFTAAVLVQAEQEGRWHLVYVTPDGLRLDAVGTTPDIRERGLSPSESVKTPNALTHSRLTQEALTPIPALTAELQRLAAEQQQLKAELDPLALLLRIKHLEALLACLYVVGGEGASHGYVFPGPRAYPFASLDARWNGTKCPGQ